MIDKTILHYEILEKLGEDGNLSRFHPKEATNHDR